MISEVNVLLQVAVFAVIISSTCMLLECYAIGYQSNAGILIKYYLGDTDDAQNIYVYYALFKQNYFDLVFNKL